MTCDRRVEPYPLWARIPFTAFVAILVPVYWHEYGPGNFLWFSDIALFAVLFTLWTGNRLAYSMMAVGVLPLEIAWTLDFITGGNLIGLSAYMFEATSPIYLRALSLFHLFLPPMIIWMLIRQGYDVRAPWAQTLLTWIVLPATLLLTAPDDNINWVYGVGDDAALPLPHAAYFAAYMALLPIVMIWPMHWLMKKVFVR
jgi:hypothetical protein